MEAAESENTDENMPFSEALAHAEKDEDKTSSESSQVEAAEMENPDGKMSFSETLAHAEKD